MLVHSVQASLPPIANAHSVARRTRAPGAWRCHAGASCMLPSASEAMPLFANADEHGFVSVLWSTLV